MIRGQHWLNAKSAQAHLMRSLVLTYIAAAPRQSDSRSAALCQIAYPRRPLCRDLRYGMREPRGERAESMMVTVVQQHSRAGPFDRVPRTSGRVLEVAI